MPHAVRARVAGFRRGAQCRRCNRGGAAVLRILSERAPSRGSPFFPLVGYFSTCQAVLRLLLAPETCPMDAGYPETGQFRFQRRDQIADAHTTALAGRKADR